MSSSCQPTPTTSSAAYQTQANVSVKGSTVVAGVGASALLSANGQLIPSCRYSDWCKDRFKYLCAEGDPMHPFDQWLQECCGFNPCAVNAAAQRAELIALIPRDYQ